MATLVRVEPSRFRADEAWFVFDDGRQCLRKLAPAARSGGVAIISDHIEPVQSMADGRTYDSKSALYRSYRADGNPQGIRYECVGNEDTTRFTPPARDKAKSIAAIKRALGDL
jgi:hypothetical protein